MIASRLMADICHPATTTRLAATSPTTHAALNPDGLSARPCNVRHQPSPLTVIVAGSESAKVPR